MRMLLAAIVWMVGVVPVLAQDTAGAGALAGAVVANGAAVSDAAVCLPAIGRCAVTDDRGAFRIDNVRAGEYAVEVVAPGRPMLPLTAAVRAGLDTVLEITAPETPDLTEVVNVTAPRFVAADEIKTSGFLVSAAEVAQSAGALQDVSRYVQSLPGVVVGTDDFRNDLIVRGGSPLENLYIVDNVEIPNINTYANFASAGGTVSMLDAALLQDVTFLTGGFPAVFGNRTSSVLQVSLREGDRSRTGGRVTFGFAGVGAVAEGGLGAGRGSWIASVRRSVLDVVTDDTGIGGVPVLYTLNGKVTYDLSPRDRVWLLNVSGVDSIRLGLTEDSDLTETLSTLDIRYSGRRYATGVNWQRTFGAAGVGLLGATYTRARVDQRIRDLLRGGVDADATVAEQIAAGVDVFFEDSTESELGAKYDLTLNVGRAGKLQGGASIKQLRYRYDAASPYGADGPYFRQADINPFALREQNATLQRGAYLQSSRTIGPRVGVTAGLRLDHAGYLPGWRTSPRLGVSVKLAPGVAVKGAVGRYYQQPFMLFVTAFPENRGVAPFRADHAVAGVEWLRDSATRVSVEGYFKRYDNYPVSADVPSLSLANIGDTFAIRDVLFPLRSTGVGDARGVEFLAERKATPSGRWFGQANLAFSRTRHAGSDGVRRPGSFDYPIAANLVGTYRVNERWLLSARAVYLDGRPLTPIDSDASTAGRRLVYDVTRVNAERAPDYFRADLRIDRVLAINGRTLTVFAGVQNLTNRKNFSGFSWDRRNNSVKVSQQLGLFPILGVDWQF